MYALFSGSPRQRGGRPGVIRHREPLPGGGVIGEVFDDRKEIPYRLRRRPSSMETSARTR